MDNIRSANISLTLSNDPLWLEKSDFSVPPPPFYPGKQPDDERGTTNLLQEASGSASSLLETSTNSETQPLTPGLFVDPAVVYFVDQVRRESSEAFVAKYANSELFVRTEISPRDHRR